MSVRSFLFLLFTYILSQPTFSQNVELDKVGFPDYKRIFSKHLAFRVLNTNNSSKEFYVPPRGINNFRNLKDTLHFTALISDTDSLLDVTLQNKVDNIHFRFDEGIAYFDDESHEIKFNVIFNKNATNLALQKNKNSENAVDSTYGYVYFQNHFLRFHNFKLDNGSLNIGIVDKDINGIIDKNDLIVISEDEYFMTLQNDVTATSIKDINVLKHYDNVYMITWDKGYHLNVEHLTSNLSSNNNYDLKFDGKIPNIILDDTKQLNLLSVASKSDISIVSIWSVFTPSCIEDLTILNRYNENVIGLEESRDMSQNGQTEILFPNFKLSSDRITELGFNGFPNYVIIDKELNILFHSRSLNEALSYFNENH